MGEKMIKIWDKYSTTTVLLLTAAILFVTVPLILKLTEFISAAFVIAGISCIILGSFIIMFTGNEPIDPHLVELLMAQASINQCRTASDNGITGNAYFLPPRITGRSGVLQFNPVSKDYGDKISAKGSFSPKDEGLITIPSSDLLIQSLRERNALVIPNRKEELNVLLSETICEVFEFASHISPVWENEKVMIKMHDYRYIEGCLLARSESPDCCSRYPCPACSLCGVLITEGIESIVSLDQCSVGLSSADVCAVFSIMPLHDRNT